jgi:hypothetical protein
MYRRQFLMSSLPAAAALRQVCADDRVNHYLPRTDTHYRKVQS